MNTRTFVAKDDSYLDRNSPWLYPAVMTFIIVTAPLLLGKVFYVQTLLPSSFILAFAILGSVLTGFRSIQVDTVSSKVVRFISAAVITGSAFVLILR